MKTSTSMVLSGLLLLVACESNDPAPSSPDDAGIHPIDSGTDRGAPNADDAGSDAPVDSGPTRGPVTIAVRDYSGPVASVQVVIQEAGQPLVVATTAANGELVRDVGKGAVVYAVFPSLRQIDTVTGVEPGDRIDLRVPANKPPSMDLSVDLSAFPVDGGGFTYLMRTRTSGYALSPGANTTTIGTWKDANNGTVDLLFAAIGAGVLPEGWATKTGIPVAATGSTTVAANDWTPSAASSQFLTTGGTLAGASSTNKGVSFIRDGGEHYFSTATTAGSGPAPALDFVRPPATFTPFARHVVSNAGGSFPASWSSTRVVQEPIGSGNFTQDLGALLPAITTANAGGTFSAPTVAYTAGGALPIGSSVDVKLETSIDGGEPFRWYVRTTPSAAGAVTMPTLPDAVAAATDATDAGATTWSLKALAFVESAQIDAKTARGIAIHVGDETTFVPPKTGNAIIRVTAFGGSSTD